MIRSQVKIVLWALLATALMVIYAQFVMGGNSLCFSLDEGPNSLGLNFGFNRDEVLNFFSVRSTEQLMCYRKFLTVYDSVFPLFYTAMYLLWFRFLFPKWKLLFILPLPFAHMMCDWSENYFEVLLLDQFLDIKTVDTGIVSIASVLTVTKWVLSFATYTVILFGITVRIKRSVSRNS